MTDYDAHRNTLVGLQNSLNDAEGDLEAFHEPDGDEGLSAGQNALATLRNAASDLAALINEISDQVRDAERAQDPGQSARG
jgi:hypothetical protein